MSQSGGAAAEPGVRGRIGAGDADAACGCQVVTHDTFIHLFVQHFKEIFTEAKIRTNYFEMDQLKKAIEHLDIVMETWKNADPIYKPAIEARQKWAEWNKVN